MVTALDYGDLLCATDQGDLLLIERKTPTDLLGSIEDGRVRIQCVGMRTRTDYAYLLVCGQLAESQGKTIADGRLTGWNWDSVQGALLSIQESGVAVVHTTAAGFEATVIRLADRERSGEKVLPIKMDSRVMSNAEQILTSLPGIGWQRATDLLRHFEGRAGDALAWLTWEGSMGEVAGIGKGTKRDIRKALQIEADQELYLWSKVDFDTYEEQVLSQSARKEAKPKRKTTEQILTAMPAEKIIIEDADGILIPQ